MKQENEPVQTSAEMVSGFANRHNIPIEVAERIVLGPGRIPVMPFPVLKSELSQNAILEPTEQ